MLFGVASPTFSAMLKDNSGLEESAVQVYFPAGQATFHSYLPDRQGLSQVM